MITILIINLKKLMIYKIMLLNQEDKLIILQNLNSIQAYLYDLYNMNYKIIDDQKFVRICLENFNE